MTNRNKLMDAASSLDNHEQADIEHKVNFELIDKQYLILKIGSIVGFIGSLIVLSSFYHNVNLFVLLSWFFALSFVNLFNVSFAYYYQHHKPSAQYIKPWQQYYRVLVGIVCLLWGSIGVLFVSQDIHYQFYLIFTLFVLIVCLGLGNIMDFITSVISITCLLIPYTVFYVYIAVISGALDYNLNLQFATSLCVLGLFLVVTSYIGYKLLKQTIRLNFVNLALSHKLENANKFLEQRVKERTADLEKSLKLVTYQATHDLLTDLPNPRLLTEYMNALIKSPQKSIRMFGVFFVSLNEIDKISDGFGHRVSDRVIKNIAQRFQKKFTVSGVTQTEGSIRYTVTISRKDEFVILAEPITQIEDIENSAKAIFSVLEEPIYHEKQVIKLTASIGVSVYPKDGTDVESLLMNADAAIGDARRRGGNSVNIYKAEINADTSKQLVMASYLHNAIKNKEFILLYQPFVDITTNKICGMEALIRWEHPKLGFISPMDFIPLAEANGMIVPLGEWVLKTACEQTEKWHNSGFKSLKLAVNLSAKQLLQKNIVQMVKTILDETHLNPAYLELELTETEAFKEEVLPIIKQLKELNLGLSIDDFGTGYSGLTNLKLFKIDKLKIDKSFVQDVSTNGDSKAIVANIISLAKELKIQVLAEGVETKEQLQLMQKYGCHMIQGYYFSHPINADAFTRLLETTGGFFKNQ